MPATAAQTPLYTGKGGRTAMDYREQKVAMGKPLLGIKICKKTKKI